MPRYKPLTSANRRMYTPKFRFWEAYFLRNRPYEIAILVALCIACLCA